MPLITAKLAREDAGTFSEAAAWRTVSAGGWRPVYGNFRDLGYSIEWHDFTTERDLDWSPSFHAGGVEICLNLEGNGYVRAGEKTLELAPLTGGFYCQNKARLTGLRKGEERHQFLTIELSFGFIEQHIQPKETGLHLNLRDILAGKTNAEVSRPVRLTHEQQQLALNLRRPPVSAAAQRMWYHAKALEIASVVLYQADTGEEFFCQRHRRQSLDRVQGVIAILKENMAEPPTLEEIGRRVGCSQFHLSRTFSREMGCGIFQYLRSLRMERAAELLRQGKLNVTQVAMEVGYTSASHFSTAFNETFGCSPGLFF